MVENIFTGQTINLGIQGENKATIIEIDVHEFATAHGEGTPVLVHRRPGDSKPHICDIDYSASQHKISWLITESETHNAGSGSAEIRWFVNDVIAKSATFTTAVQASLVDSEAEIAGSVVYMTKATIAVENHLAALEALQGVDCLHVKTDYMFAYDYSRLYYTSKPDHGYSVRINSYEGSNGLDVEMIFYRGRSNEVGSVVCNEVGKIYTVDLDDDFDQIMLVTNTEVETINLQLLEEAPIVRAIKALLN